MRLLNTIKSFFLKNFKEIDKIHREKAIDDLEWEILELKHIFALTTMGIFIGLPSTPLPVTFSLLPDMHDELAVMLSRLDTAYSPLSDQFSKLDVV